MKPLICVLLFLTPGWAWAIDYKDISVGGNYTCGVSGSNNVGCWGTGPYSLFQIPKELNGKVVLQVETGLRHACALAQGKIYCWGANDLGQTDVPKVVKEQELISISIGYFQTCAINQNFKPFCWGHGASGENSIPEDLGRVQAISAGPYYNCALRHNGQVRCWGSNAWGQLEVPSGLKNPRKIQTGRYSACAMTDEGMRCWHDESTPKLGKISNFLVGDGFTCANSNEGTFCWGYDLFGNISGLQRIYGPEVGASLKMDGSRHTACGIFASGTRCWNPLGEASWWNNWMNASLPGTFSDLKKIGISDSGICALIGTELQCWGDFPTRAKGNISDIPYDVRTVHDFSLGSNFACALTEDKKITCWSPYSEDFGQLNAPDCLVNPTQLVSGNSHSCVLDDGKVRCWGHNLYGQSTPPDLTQATQIAAGSFHSCAVQNNRIYCWGINKGGEINVPKIEGKIEKLVAHGHHSCVLTTDGQLSCWGKRDHAEFGVPGDLGPALDVSIGSVGICALVEKGMRCWGHESQMFTQPDFQKAQKLYGGWFSHCLVNEEKALCTAKEGSNFFWQSLRQAPSER